MTTSRRILVTGTSYGLGAAIAELILQAGDSVVATSRTPPSIGKDGWVEADLGDIAGLSAVVTELGRLADGRFDGVVLNAGIAERSRSQWSAAEVERHFRINALAPFAIFAELQQQDLLADPCNVVLLGSYLQHGNPRQPAYAMSKAALHAWLRSFTMSQAAEHPVSMNMIWPGRVATPGNPVRDLPAGDPNPFYSADAVAQVVLRYVHQPPGGPRGTVVDLGRS